MKVIPLLLVHGWPGSVVEFQKIIPMLTTPRDNRNFVFEVVIPSLPGYGFSQAAVRPGMGPAQVKTQTHQDNSLQSYALIEINKFFSIVPIDWCGL